MNISVPTAVPDHNKDCEAKCRPVGCTSDNELQIVVQNKKQTSRQRQSEKRTPQTEQSPMWPSVSTHAVHGEERDIAKKGENKQFSSYSNEWTSAELPGQIQFERQDPGVHGKRYLSKKIQKSIGTH